METITQLYPPPAQTIPLSGTYLAHNLRQHTQGDNQVFVYTNFVVSLDGRIAVRRPGDHSMHVPQATANDRDWRLFQELAAQADLIISSGRYLREHATGSVQEILQVDDPRFSDLRSWRQNHGLRPQPDIAIISGSLQFPIPDVLTAGGRKAIFFTTGNPDPVRVAEIESKGGPLYVVGEKSVRGDLMVSRLAELGYRTIYSAAGPKVLHLLLSAGVLNRLYLTHANRLLGGQVFASLVDGDLFNSAVGMTINSIYLDATALDGLGQLFISYDSPSG